MYLQSSDIWSILIPSKKKTAHIHLLDSQHMPSGDQNSHIAKTLKASCSLHLYLMLTQIVIPSSSSLLHYSHAIQGSHCAWTVKLLYLG